MKFKDFELKPGNYFVAMEYYALILNRTFLVLLTDTGLVGLKGNGAVSVEGGRDLLTREISKSMAIRGDLKNPFSYVKDKYLDQYQNEDVGGADITKNHKDNFRIDYADIWAATYDKKKKWGMGPYPHDGKVFVMTNNGKKREFIIMGEQSGNDIKDWILTRQSTKR